MLVYELSGCGFESHCCHVILLSKCAICSTKNKDLLKKQEASEILSSLGIKTSLSKIQLFDDVSF